MTLQRRLIEIPASTMPPGPVIEVLAEDLPDEGTNDEPAF